MATILDKKEIIIDLYKNKQWSVSGIARHLGLQTGAVSAFLRRQGIRAPISQVQTPPEKEKLIMEDYISGMATSEISKKYDISENTIVVIAKRTGTPVRPIGGQKYFFTDEQVDDITNMWISGVSQQKIGEKYNVGQLVISRLLRRKGVENPNNSRSSRGSKHSTWKSGKYMVTGGYWLVNVPIDHKYISMANNLGYILEHRLVMAEKLGRPLEKRETVHHIDGDRSNNHPDNLQLRQGNHGIGIRHQCLDCGSSNVEPVPLD